MDSQQIYTKIQEHYDLAVGNADKENSYIIAKALGYTEKELASIPQGANLGLSCGNPLVLASLNKV
jgi:arsenite methyltransferase